MGLSCYGRHVLLIITVLLIFSSGAIAQGGKVLVVVDVETKEPLSYASLAIQNTARGTVSNAKGEFYLDEIKNSDTVIVSYIGYVSERLLGLDVLKMDTLNLEANINILKSVTITADEGFSILSKVVEHLDRNHKVENTVYNMYHYSEHEKENGIEITEGVFEITNSAYMNQSYYLAHQRAFVLKEEKKKTYTKARMISIKWDYEFNHRIAKHGVKNSDVNFLKRKNFKKLDVEVSEKYVDPVLGSIAVLAIKEKKSGDIHKLVVSNDDYGIVEIDYAGSYMHVRYRKGEEQYYLSHIFASLNAGYRHHIFYDHKPLNPGDEVKRNFRSVEVIDDFDRQSEDAFWKEYRTFVKPWSSEH